MLLGIKNILGVLISRLANLHTQKHGFGFELHVWLRLSNAPRTEAHDALVVEKFINSAWILISAIQDAYLNDTIS